MRHYPRSFVGSIIACTVIGISLFGVSTMASAGEPRQCHYSTTTRHYGCNGTRGVTASGDIIGASLFTGQNFTGNELTIWVPRPCPKNNFVDYFVTLHASRKKVMSVQPWSTCWIWLYYKDGRPRSGPYEDNTPDLGSYNDNEAVMVGLS
ncbi:hypothetical protein C5D47_07625 [Rathayibacter toxicus]|uniref:Uncharacterized protein n=2 Tax=Rathayibacter toxicus TaxID=145458 RepID=A0A2S5Y5Y5_9MICO|nr:hypothetical protein C5D15_07590 [Rathayibacter toxicus]PPG45481.1 hypothetical protein C5D16_07560 [Rathayibacter toxicus]PPH22581.1 hypothetical protein C5D17_07595 [Rathayibacter toxicus]PPH56782.1 hypothetical protein C5D30_07585 [Rathayibacter toxicus]PPH59474.1 hypothetical protein C5C93_07620 [Rathayibacter toxicus]